MSVKDGSRPEKYFEKLPEACNWLADAIYEDRHGRIPKGKDMTVDQRYHFRMDNLICDLAPNTRRNYAERYLIQCAACHREDEDHRRKTMHCKAILNRMEPIYAGSTIISMR